MDFNQLIQYGTVSEVAGSIDSNVSLIEQHLETVKPDAEKNERNRVLYSVLLKVKTYLHCLKSSLEEPTEQVAFASRGLFELNVLTRYILMDETNLKRFIGAAELDKKEILEGVLEATESGPVEAPQVLKDFLVRMEVWIKAQAPPIRKLPNWKDMAEKVNLEQEYTALYKLFSKYVHPSSYSLNVTFEAFHGYQTRILFLLFAQIYAHDTFDRIKKETTGEGVSLRGPWTFRLLHSDDREGG